MHGATLKNAHISTPHKDRPPLLTNTKQQTKYVLSNSSKPHNLTVSVLTCSVCLTFSDEASVSCRSLNMVDIKTSRTKMAEVQDRADTYGRNISSNDSGDEPYDRLVQAYMFTR
jgi:hypothetical protein